MNPTPLADKLAQSYAGHPAFQFGAPAWPLDTAAMSAFDQAWAAVRDQGPSSNPAAQLARCEARLLQVFARLASGAADDMERRFLAELLAECQRITRVELGHHAQAKPAPRVPARPGAEPSLLARLQAERHFFSALPPAAVEQMRALATPAVAGFRANAAAGRLTREDLSTNTGPVVNGIVAILNREFGAQGILDAVSDYMGLRMAVGGLALELSLPQAGWWSNALGGLARPAHTLYAHFDETVNFPKSIVYLSDVDSTTGPTSCYPGVYDALQLSPLAEVVGRVLANVGNAPDSPLRAHYQKRYHQSISSQPFRQHFMRLPAALRFNSHFGWDVLPDSALEADLVERERVMTGPAGTCIVFDGARLLHRGGLMQQGERLALQVIFSPPPSLRSRIVGKLKGALA